MQTRQHALLMRYSTPTADWGCSAGVQFLYAIVSFRIALAIFHVARDSSSLYFILAIESKYPNEPARLPSSPVLSLMALSIFLLAFAYPCVGTPRS